jgi:hypothetical protein
MKLLIANGALLQAPVYETHPSGRGTNWLAVIDIDATSPGGLARRFMQTGKGAETPTETDEAEREPS